MSRLIDAVDELFEGPPTKWIQVERGVLVAYKRAGCPSEQAPLEEMRVTAFCIINGKVEAMLRTNRVDSAMRQRTCTSLDLLHSYKPLNESAKLLFEALRASVKLLATDHD